jgi:hypothetical protein
VPRIGPKDQKTWLPRHLGLRSSEEAVNQFKPLRDSSFSRRPTDMQSEMLALLNEAETFLQPL